MPPRMTKQACVDNSQDSVPDEPRYTDFQSTNQRYQNLYGNRGPLLPQEDNVPRDTAIENGTHQLASNFNLSSSTGRNLLNIYSGYKQDNDSENNSSQESNSFGGGGRLLSPWSVYGSKGSSPVNGSKGNSPSLNVPPFRQEIAPDKAQMEVSGFDIDSQVENLERNFPYKNKSAPNMVQHEDRLLSAGTDKQDLTRAHETESKCHYSGIEIKQSAPLKEVFHQRFEDKTVIEEQPDDTNKRNLSQIMNLLRKKPVTESTRGNTSYSDRNIETFNQDKQITQSFKQSINLAHSNSMTVNATETYEMNKTGVENHRECGEVLHRNIVSNSFKAAHTTLDQNTEMVNDWCSDRGYVPDTIERVSEKSPRSFEDGASDGKENTKEKSKLHIEAVKNYIDIDDIDGETNDGDNNVDLMGSFNINFSPLSQVTDSDNEEEDNVGSKMEGTSTCKEDEDSVLQNSKNSDKLMIANKETNSVSEISKYNQNITSNKTKLSDAVNIDMTDNIAGINVKAKFLRNDLINSEMTEKDSLGEDSVRKYSDVLHNTNIYDSTGKKDLGEISDFQILSENNKACVKELDTFIKVENKQLSVPSESDNDSRNTDCDKNIIMNNKLHVKKEIDMVNEESEIDNSTNAYQLCSENCNEKTEDKVGMPGENVESQSSRATSLSQDTMDFSCNTYEDDDSQNYVGIQTGHLDMLQSMNLPSQVNNLNNVKRTEFDDRKIADFDVFNYSKIQMNKGTYCIDNGMETDMSKGSRLRNGKTADEDLEPKTGFKNANLKKETQLCLQQPINKRTKTVLKQLGTSDFGAPLDIDSEDPIGNLHGNIDANPWKRKENAHRKMVKPLGQYGTQGLSSAVVARVPHDRDDTQKASPYWASCRARDQMDDTSIEPFKQVYINRYRQSPFQQLSGPVFSAESSPSFFIDWQDSKPLIQESLKADRGELDLSDYEQTCNSSNIERTEDEDEIYNKLYQPRLMYDKGNSKNNSNDNHIGPHSPDLTGSLSEISTPSQDSIFKRFFKNENNVDKELDFIRNPVDCARQHTMDKDNGDQYHIRKPDIVTKYNARDTNDSLKYLAKRGEKSSEYHTRNSSNDFEFQDSKKTDNSKTKYGLHFTRDSGSQYQHIKPTFSVSQSSEDYFLPGESKVLETCLHTPQDIASPNILDNSGGVKASLVNDKPLSSRWQNFVSSQASDGCDIDMIELTKKVERSNKEKKAFVTIENSPGLYNTQRVVYQNVREDQTQPSSYEFSDTEQINSQNESETCNNKKSSLENFYSFDISNLQNSFENKECTTLNTENLNLQKCLSENFDQSKQGTNLNQQEHSFKSKNLSDTEFKKRVGHVNDAKIIENITDDKKVMLETQMEHQVNYQATADSMEQLFADDGFDLEIIEQTEGNLLTEKKKHQVPDLDVDDKEGIKINKGFKISEDCANHSSLSKSYSETRNVFYDVKGSSETMNNCESKETEGGSENEAVVPSDDDDKFEPGIEINTNQITFDVYRNNDVVDVQEEVSVIAKDKGSNAETYADKCFGAEIEKVNKRVITKFKDIDKINRESNKISDNVNLSEKNNTLTSPENVSNRNIYINESDENREASSRFSLDDSLDFSFESNNVNIEETQQSDKNTHSMRIGWRPPIRASSQINQTLPSNDSSKLSQNMNTEGSGKIKPTFKCLRILAQSKFKVNAVKSEPGTVQSGVNKRCEAVVSNSVSERGTDSQIRGNCESSSPQQSPKVLNDNDSACKAAADTGRDMDMTLKSRLSVNQQPMPFDERSSRTASNKRFKPPTMTRTAITSRPLGSPNLTQTHPCAEKQGCSVSQTELRFPSKSETERVPNCLRQVVIPETFPSATVYKQILTAAVTEYVNTQLFEVSKKFHRALSTVDTSGYSEYKSRNKGSNVNNPNPACQCGVPSKMISVKKEGPNCGRYFYACSADRKQQCKFFQWADENRRGSVTSSSRRKIQDVNSLNLYMKDQYLHFYGECQLIKRTKENINKYFKAPKWARGRADSDMAQKKQILLKLPFKGRSSLYAKDDIWVVSKHLDFDPLHTFLARSTFYGPSSSLEVEIDPISGYSPSNWRNEEMCHAVLAGNVSSELSCLDNIREHIQAQTPPVLPYLLNRQTEDTGRSFTNNKGFQAPRSVAGNLSSRHIHIHSEQMDDLSYEYIKKYSLNRDQAEALRRVANMFSIEKSSSVDSILLIHGVFGAGKSYLLSVMVLFLVEVFQLNDSQSPDNPFPWKLLISSTTNVAVDRILNGLLELGFEDFVRVGSVKKISKPVLPFSVHASGTDSQELKDLQEMLRSGDLTVTEKSHVRQSIEKHRLGENKKKLGRVKVVGATCASCSLSCLNQMEFPLVLLDECSQMTEPASLLPIAKFGCQKLILVGDPKQLDPTIQGAEAAHQNGLEQTMFDRLIKMGSVATLLRTQYRCHPHISAVANKLFYGGMLENGVTDSERKPLLDILPTICYYDVERGEECCEGVGSYYNEREAQFVVFMLQVLLASGIQPSSIGVITLYKSQMARISDLLTSGESTDMKGIQVSTVDAFQGGERDVIILSTVRSQACGFIDNDKRTNVALTRAKHHLLIVGNLKNLSKNILWGRVINHCKSFSNGIQSGDEARHSLELYLDHLRENATSQTSENSKPVNSQNSNASEKPKRGRKPKRKRKPSSSDTVHKELSNNVDIDNKVVEGKRSKKHRRSGNEMDNEHVNVTDDFETDVLVEGSILTDEGRSDSQPFSLDTPDDHLSGVSGVSSGCSDIQRRRPRHVTKLSTLIFESDQENVDDDEDLPVFNL